MIEKRIEHIAYRLEENRKNKQPGAIVLIGAGCSVSAGIPTAGVIVDQVMKKYDRHPDIRSFSAPPSYADLMACLDPVQRKEIFREYVARARVNVSHIYLAHLLAEGYVDYVLTVNFDDLALRALALFNIFPPVFDLSILKDLTTTTLDTGSLTFLHGRHSGLWQLNTREEMAKIHIGNIAGNILNKIANNRPWIVVGYSGDDFIFDHLAALGRFDNGLYWVGYRKNEPSKRVRDGLLDKPNTESFWVKDHDSDSFFLALNAALDVGDPKIFNKPFSFLADLQENIKDIEGSDFYKPVKQRFETSRAWVQDAINKYERREDKKPAMTAEEIGLSQLKKELIDCLINKRYHDLPRLEALAAEQDDGGLQAIVADIYFNWATELGNQALTTVLPGARDLFTQAFEKFGKAVSINPQKHSAWYNWGTDLGNLARLLEGPEQESLYREAFGKLARAVEIAPHKEEAWFNWGTYLGSLAQVKHGEEADALYAEAFGKYEKATTINPGDDEIWTNWGIDLGNMALTRKGEEADRIFGEAYAKFRKATELKPDKEDPWFNWANILSNHAKARTGAEADGLFAEASEKYNKAVLLNPSRADAWLNWGLSLESRAATKQGKEAEELFRHAADKLFHTVKLDPANHEAFRQLGFCATNLASGLPVGQAESLYVKADDYFGKAADLKPDESETWYRWATNQGDFARKLSGPRAEEMFRAAIEKFERALSLGGSCYNYACLCAITGRKEEAFRLLDIAMKNGEETFTYVEGDRDWDGLREEPGYIELKNKYLKL